MMILVEKLEAPNVVDATDVLEKMVDYDEDYEDSLKAILNYTRGDRSQWEKELFWKIDLYGTKYKVFLDDEGSQNLGDNVSHWSALLEYPDELVQEFVKLLGIRVHYTTGVNSSDEYHLG